MSKCERCGKDSKGGGTMNATTMAFLGYDSSYRLCLACIRAWKEHTARFLDAAEPIRKVRPVKNVSDEELDKGEGAVYDDLEPGEDEPSTGQCKACGRSAATAGLLNAVWTNGYCPDCQIPERIATRLNALEDRVDSHKLTIMRVSGFSHEHPEEEEQAYIIQGLAPFANSVLPLLEAIKERVGSAHSQEEALKEGQLPYHAEPLPFVLDLATKVKALEALVGDTGRGDVVHRIAHLELKTKRLEGFSHKHEENEDLEAIKEDIRKLSARLSSVDGAVRANTTCYGRLEARIARL